MTSVKKLKTRLRQGSRLSCNEVRRLLESSGFVLVRQRGSHEQWVRSGRCFTLACHGKDAPMYILDELKKLLKE